MAHSFAETPTLTCPQCGVAFTPEVWLIVDAAERPELVERVIDGTIHEVVCPNEHHLELDAPLLLYRPGEYDYPKLIFSPANKTDREQDQNALAELAVRLAVSLGQTWRNEWLNNGLRSIPRALLAEILGNGQIDDQPADKESDIPQPYQDLIDAAEAAEQVYLATGDAAKLDEAIACWQQILDDPDSLIPLASIRSALLNNAAIVFSRRHRLSNRPDDLDRALSYWQQAVDLTPEGSLDLPGHLNNLGNGLRERYLRANDTADLNAAIAALDHAATIIAVDSPHHTAIHNNWGNGLSDLYALTGNIAHLHDAIRAYQTAVTGSPLQTTVRPSFLKNLGDSYRERYIRLGVVDDLHLALETYREALQGMPADSLDRAPILNSLSVGLRDKYSAVNDVSALEEASHLIHEALRLVADTSVNRPGYLSNLGNVLRDQYARTSNATVLDEAIAAFADAVALSPPGALHRAGYLNNLGLGLLDRYALAGRGADLDEAITFLQTAVASARAGSINQGSYLNNLGIALSTRFSRTRAPADLDDAIAAFERVIADTPETSPDWLTSLSNLGVGLTSRYTLRSDPADVDRAILVLEDLKTRTPTTAAAYAPRLNNLAAARRIRYEQTQIAADLESVIRLYQDALANTPLGSPTRPKFLNNLGVGLSARYDRTNELDDLNEALALLDEATALTPIDSPNRPMYLNSLANGLRARFLRLGREEDLDQAIVGYRDVVRLAEATGSSLMATFFNNLSIGFRDRYELRGSPADLANALAYNEKAVLLSPQDGSERANIAGNLGDLLLDQYEQGGEPAHLTTGIAAYEDAIATLDRALVFSPVAYLIGQQSRWAGLYARTVLALLAAGRTADALAVAEGSKSRLLANLMGRGDLPAPAGIPAELAARERQAADRLRALDATELAERGRNEPTGDGHRRVADRAAVVTDLRAVWDEMAAHGPAAADFVALRRGDRPTAAGLLRLAGALPAGAALLSLFYTGERTLLCLLRPGAAEPAVMAAAIDRDTLLYDTLPNYEDEIQHGADHRALGRPLTHRWRELGRALLGPLLPHLAGIDHLIVAPEGVYHQLPLHALWIGAAGSAESQTTLIDHCAVSYIPALGLLERLILRPQRDSEPPAAGGRPSAAVLGYTDADPTTDKGARERDIFLGEARAVAARLGVAPLLDEAATGAALEAAIGQPLRRLHLSCHGYFDSDDALASGVLLADGVYTARRFMERRLRAELVTLSACQTAISGSLGGDEMAGLSMGLLSAGAGALLLGLWSVASRTTAALMDRFYATLDGPGGAAGTKAETLRRVMLAFRAGDMMPEQAGFDPADPYYWAPFVLVGDWR